MRKLRWKLVVVGAGGTLLVTACATPSEPESGPQGSNTPAMAKLEDQPEASWWATLELAAIHALDDVPHQKGARFEPDKNRVVVTIWTLGEEFSEARLHELQGQAAEATGDVDVVIELSHDDPPVEN